MSGVVRRCWLSILLLGIVISLQIASWIDPGIHGWLIDNLAVTWASIRRGEVYRLVASPLIQPKPGFVGTEWILIFLVPVLEWRIGWWQTLVTFFAGDWLSTLTVLFALRIAAIWNVGDAAALIAQPNAGPSSGQFAVAAALAMTFPSGWRGALLTLELGFLSARLVLVGKDYDYQHLLAALAAIGLYLLMARRKESPSPATAAAHM